MLSHLLEEVMMRSLHFLKIRRFQKFWAIALTSMVMVGGVAQGLNSGGAIAAVPSHPTTVAQLEPVPSSPSSTRLPRTMMRRLQRHASQQFDIHPREARVINATQTTWPDGCLGLASPDEICTMALVPGWQVEMTDGEQSWVYRTDRRAQQIRLAETDTASLPAPVIDRLFAAIARDANVPVSSLRLLEAEPATWDGCMGIFEPDQACTEIAIFGYRAIVMGDRQSWVYHLDQNGSRIAQNATASGSLTPIDPSFIPTNGAPPLPSETVVFKMTVSGSLTGEMTETMLTEDGLLYRISNRMQNSGNPERTVLKRLSPQQVQQFKQVLNQQKFPNLNGMRYLTSAALADYPTTTFQAMNSTVSYIDLEEDSLPAALQNVIQAWNRL